MPPPAPAASLLHRKQSFVHLDNRGRLPMRLILSYAAPGIATTSISFLVAVYITDFYVSLGANLGFISFFTALARSRARST